MHRNLYHRDNKPLTRQQCDNTTLLADIPTDIHDLKKVKNYITPSSPPHYIPCTPYTTYNPHFLTT